MMIPGNRAYAHARKTFAPADIATSFGATQFADFPHIFAVNSKRRIGSILRDFALIAVSWTAFIGVIFFPVAQLIGLLACSLALFLLPNEQQKTPGAARARAS
jgi:hypothetical protein